LIDAAKASEEVQQLRLLLSIDPDPTLLKPVVEKIDALAATDHPDPQLSSAQLVPFVVDTHVLDPGAGADVRACGTPAAARPG
jgi:hypothetical protein